MEAAEDSPAAEEAAEDAPAAKAEPGLTGSKLRELMDAGLGEEQVAQMLAAEGLSSDVIERLLVDAQALPAAPRRPAPPPVPPPEPAPPVPAAEAPPQPKTTTYVAAAPRPPPPPTAAVIDADEKLYPMPEVQAEQGMIELPYVPFPIAKSAFVISAAAVTFALTLLAYLLWLTR